MNMNMKASKELHLLRCFLVLCSVMLGSSIANHDQKDYYCGNIRRAQTPFLNPNPSILSSITLCRSQNLYFKTSLGLFQVSSVDLNGSLLTISHSTCTSSIQYLSPLAVTAGLPSPPEPNSLILFNCSITRYPFLPLLKNCTHIYKCGGAEEHEKSPYSCLVIEDLKKVGLGFHPRNLNCSHYTWAHKSSSHGEDHGELKFGARISFNTHVPDICKGCQKPNDTCGAGLNCLCHAKECKDKVISEVGSITFTGTVYLALLVSFLSLV
ncbi:hypothetical protein HN51_009824 [Arachis hypogaea]|uniref:Wall-associated receptor kinase galacturonan-binding domain-containing protein n=1 Tax=Arachis hypogaea TaxID=3818 RepID=A0A445E4X8_ARAHY|nr:uncharacterized protein LOC112784825 [Arachis hypogaea]QHO54794.1 uncharacterized protein DS421_3g59920 [Arachis hypogaea]RYR70516.1 hypothetical protein Ahy_A03g017001 [Arachis hypogaea]